MELYHGQEGNVRDRLDFICYLGFVTKVTITFAETAKSSVSCF